MSATEPTPAELTRQVADISLTEKTPEDDTTAEEEKKTEKETAVQPPVVAAAAKPAAVGVAANKKLTPAQKAAAAKKAIADKKAAANPTPAAEKKEEEVVIFTPIQDIRPTDHISRKLGKRPEDLQAPSYMDGETEVKQTSPPTIPITKFYTTTALPEGEWQEYLNDNSYRTTSTEMQEKDRLRAEELQALREGAEIHRQVRQDIQRYLVPGVRLIDIANQLEKSTLDLVESNGFERTRGFPTGLSLNHIAAHWTPNPKDTNIVLKQDDTLKVDFGVSIQGNIIDCAWTTHFNPIHDPLVEAVKQATNAGIKTAGIDVRLCDVGAAIHEVMESFEVELEGGKTLGVKCIKNLMGHSIGKYKIHAGHSIPSYNNQDKTKMLEGVLYAVETFGTTDPTGKIKEEGDCSHFMKNFDVTKLHPRTPQPAVKLWDLIGKRFSTLAFCRRWLVEAGAPIHQTPLGQLVDMGYVDPYPPLVVRKGYQTAQFEHTIFLGSTKKEVLSRSWDY